MDKGVVLITGGASGIGFAVAGQLGRAGYTVAVLGRNTQSGRQAATVAKARIRKSKSQSPITLGDYDHASK